MKIWQIIAVLLLCLVLAGTTACAGEGSEEVYWQPAEVVRSDLTVSISASGKIGISNDANLIFGSGGKVDKIYVEEGDEVTKDEVLAKLDTGPLELAFTQAQTALAQAEYTLEKTEDPFSKKEIRDARDDVHDAEDYLDYAKAMLKQAYLDNDEEAISQWETEVYLARINLGIAEEKLDAMTSDPDDDEIEILEMQVDAAEQAVAEAKKQLNEATITAPFDGLVAGVYVKEGNIIPVVTTIVYLIDPTSMELNAEVDEIDIPDVELEQRAIIEVDALPALQLEGVVASIGSLPLMLAGLVLYNVKINFDIPEGSELMVGMSATTDIILDERSNVLLVPNRAITQDSQGNPVVKVMINEQIEERPVVTGISDGFDTEILDGVSEGDVVMIETKVKPSAPGLF
jgi:multidrug efflux pump subunit AcrA (membrane-fusion protein)